MGIHGGSRPAASGPGHGAPRLRDALNRAVREELLTRNVALLVDMPKVSKDKGTAWNAREAIPFLRSVRAHRLYAACVLVLVLGLRRSEVLGLRWQDIDFEAGRFTVRSA
ncbi:integrase [Streptomyces achromogenes]|nr:integrase [Streptomyces achromogenes]